MENKDNRNFPGCAHYVVCKCVAGSEWSSKRPRIRHIIIPNPNFYTFFIQNACFFTPI
jgi:hypothetical protein